MTIKPFFQNMIGLLLRLILFEELLLSGSMKKALLCLLSGKLLEIQQRSPDERRDVRWRPRVDLILAKTGVGTARRRAFAQPTLHWPRWGGDAPLTE